MLTGMSLEELTKMRETQMERLKELQQQRQNALPVEVAPLDHLILTLEDEISGVNALILARIAAK